MKHPKSRGERLQQKRRRDTVRAPKREKLTRVRYICLITGRMIDSHNFDLRRYKRPGFVRHQERMEGVGKAVPEKLKSGGVSLS